MVLGATVDALHALLMALWIGGLPLLFWHRWPRLTFLYGIYAVAFVLISQLSRYWLGECFLTTVARHFWTNGTSWGTAATDEWFTVRFAQLVFRLTPSHRSIVWASEVLIVVTAVGVLFSNLRNRTQRRHELKFAAK